MYGVALPYVCHVCVCVCMYVCMYVNVPKVPGMYIYIYLLFMYVCMYVCLYAYSILLLEALFNFFIY